MEFRFEIDAEMDEDRIWRGNISPIFKDLPKNVREICQYGFTEIFNNVIDHSEGRTVHVYVCQTDAEVELTIEDDGIGIFQKICNRLDLEDERHAIFELAKGKLTTDPARHSGEGIFFASRMFDGFHIVSFGLKFIHENVEGEDWLVEDQSEGFGGTKVVMRLAVDSRKSMKGVFDAYTGEDFGFSRTHVPVFLAAYGDENLISRSQAKRVLARVENFKEVLFDFSGVEMIGPAFADQIFRVFKNAHPDIELVWVNAGPDVEKMILKALADGT